MKSQPEADARAADWVKRVAEAGEPVYDVWKKLSAIDVVRTLFEADAATRRAFVRATVEMILSIDFAWNRLDEADRHWFGAWVRERRLPRAPFEVSRKLLQSDLGFEEDELVALVTRTSKIDDLSTSESFLEPLVGSLEAFVAGHGASNGLKASARLLRQAILRDNAAEKKLKARLKALLGGPAKLPIQPGEAWSDAAIADLESMDDDSRVAWCELLAHCRNASGSAPASKWVKLAETAVGKVGVDELRRRVLAWFPRVNEPRTQPILRWSREYEPDPNHLIVEPHADVLKGLAWCCGMREDREVARALTALALSAYRKIPKIGPRAVKIGNACVAAFGLMPGMDGVGQLAVLKVRVKYGTAQKMIEKALETTARRVGLPRDELEEMSVPAYGLTEIGRCDEPLGEFTAGLRVEGDGVAIVWTNPAGKVQKTVPAAVRTEHGETLKELRAAAKDIERMLPAQRERLDTLFMRGKSWPLATWRERYLDHPLVGVLARRLLWEFVVDGTATAGIWYEGPAAPGGGAIVDVDVRPIGTKGADVLVRPWHPIDRDTDEISAWRVWLEEQRIRQPFKQAHRELYVVTDAELRTRTYSNRFAAHVLRQHQFSALCAARGWKNKLRLMVDGEFPPATLYLPQWNLRAEFWIEGAGDTYGTDTNETGTYHYVTTDQVRFYRHDDAQVTSGGYDRAYAPRVREVAAEPLPLDSIPPLVFSEVMRDVDLFVGVASVGNDPTWVDGGPEGRYRTYWESYSFGALGATASTRRDVLAGLVPRLKIAGQCSVGDRFLVVKGRLRTYKIHLGSGNILMEPNDRYLCIVPRQSAAAGDGGVMLPFEGDGMLSIILSKAFLLAADDRIQDPSIVSQIRGS